MHKRILHTAGAVILWAYASHSFAQYPEQWDLISSINEALVQAPQLRAAIAEINARQSQLNEADNWPNPRVLVGADDTVSLEQGSDGYALSKLDVIQPIPFGRLGAQTRQAQSHLTAAQAQQQYQFLEVEKNTANVFYALQYHSGLLALATERHESLKKLLTPGKDPLVRYFRKAERKRLIILREAAHQSMASAEGEYQEAVSQFRALLALPQDYVPSISSLQAVTSPPSLERLLESQANHPLLTTLKNSTTAAEVGIDVAKSSRRVDPELVLFSTRDVYAGRVQNSTGIALMVEVPLWNSNDKKVARARSQFYQQQAELKINRRNLESRLRKSNLHLAHVIEQAKHYREHIKAPAREILDLSSLGFKSGEINLLTFMDAHNTYYEAQAHYLMLVYQGWLETAEVRYTAGQMLTEVMP